MDTKKISPYFWFMTVALLCLAILLNIAIYQKNHLAKENAALHQQILLANEDTDEDSSTNSSQWYGMVIGIKPDKLNTYRKLHTKVPPEVGLLLQKANLRDCSVYLTQLDDGKWYVFASFRYTGTNLAHDLKKIQEGEQVLLWWAETDACHRPLPDSFNETGWKKMEAMSHLP